MTLWYAAAGVFSSARMHIGSTFSYNKILRRGFIFLIPHEELNPPAVFAGGLGSSGSFSAGRGQRVQERGRARPGALWALAALAGTLCRGGGYLALADVVN